MWRCAGPVQDDTGHLVCRYDWNAEPPEGVDWYDFCAGCRADNDRRDELRGDCERDER